MLYPFFFTGDDLHSPGGDLESGGFFGLLFFFRDLFGLLRNLFEFGFAVQRGGLGGPEEVLSQQDSGLEEVLLVLEQEKDLVESALVHVVNRGQLRRNLVDLLHLEVGLNPVGLSHLLDLGSRLGPAVQMRGLLLEEEEGLFRRLVVFGEDFSHWASRVIVRESERKR